jgi:hypothetical protein
MLRLGKRYIVIAVVAMALILGGTAVWNTYFNRPATLAEYTAWREPLVETLDLLNHAENTIRQADDGLRFETMTSEAVAPLQADSRVDIDAANQAYQRLGRLRVAGADQLAALKLLGEAGSKVFTCHHRAANSLGLPVVTITSYSPLKTQTFVDLETAGYYAQQMRACLKTLDAAYGMGTADPLPCLDGT